MAFVTSHLVLENDMIHMILSTEEKKPSSTRGVTTLSQDLIKSPMKAWLNFRFLIVENARTADVPEFVQECSATFYGTGNDVMIPDGSMQRYSVKYYGTTMMWWIQDGRNRVIEK